MFDRYFLKPLCFDFADVFLDGPRMPGIKFDKDTSALWYKPNISREQSEYCFHLLGLRVTRVLSSVCVFFCLYDNHGDVLYNTIQ